MEIMGVVNVTPDSFYAGSSAMGEKAVRMALRMLDEGADIIDIGGQSTRPGSSQVSAEKELRRIAPVVRRLSKTCSRISIDTYNYHVARFAADHGIAMINDITGMRQQSMRTLVAERKLECVIMHMQGEPKTMQASPHYDNVVNDVKRFLAGRIRLCEDDGIAKRRIIIDPGIGFGKTARHNLQILKGIGSFKSLGKRILIGASRKSFIGRINGTDKEPLPAEERLEGSLAIASYCALNGVDMLRVHDVKETIRAIEVIDALERS
ncbi:MAG: dihydropteroate synthase [Candidatus Micrarchaeota archaeon]|nr:dihydropteroate synthase [Candidatus Micrarchaeota archaeon]